MICLKSSLETSKYQKLEDTVRDELEGEITFKECQDILRAFKPENPLEMMDLRGNSTIASLIC